MDPTLLLALTGLAASVAAFLFARRRAPARLASTAAVVALCGAECLLLGAGHLFGVIGRALSGKGAGSASFTYDFRFYSLFLLGALLVVAGSLCLASIPGLAKRSLASWRMAFWSSAFLLALNLPLAPIQGFGYVLGGLSLAGIAALLHGRRLVTLAG